MCELLHTSNHRCSDGNNKGPLCSLGFSHAQHGKGRLLAVLETPPLPHCPGVRCDARAHSVRTIERAAESLSAPADKRPSASKSECAMGYATATYADVMGITKRSILFRFE